MVIMNNIIGSIILEGMDHSSEDTMIISGANSKRVIAEATLQDLEVENRNHRIYAKKDIEPEINGARIKELIKAGQMYGEMSHPLSDDLVRQQTIDKKLACVSFLKIWVEGNLVKGQYKGTLNEYGNFVDQELRDGAKPAFSLRALGAIENVNGKAYVRGVRIITYDEVIFPSHSQAYTTKILTESALSCNLDPLKIKQNDLSKYNETGRIINLTGSDAQMVLNKLQRESANINAILETFDKIADKITLSENGKYVVLTNAFGDRFKLQLEDYVDNLIMDYICG